MPADNLLLFPVAILEKLLGLFSKFLMVALPLAVQFFPDCCIACKPIVSIKSHPGYSSRPCCSACHGYTHLSVCGPVNSALFP